MPKRDLFGFLKQTEAGYTNEEYSEALGKRRNRREDENRQAFESEEISEEDQRPDCNNMC